MKTWINQALKFILITLCALNIIASFIQISSLYFNPRTPLHSLASPFIAVKDALKDVPIISYLTDKNIEDPAVLARFQLAQYTLAPSLVLLNDPQGSVALVDANDPMVMLQQLNTYRFKPAQPLADNLLLAVKQNP